MFDIAFSEILVIAVVALIVIGPERLPRVARTAGHLFGRLQRYVTQVKSDINREMELDELRKLQSSVQEAARSLEQDFQKEVRQAEGELKSVEESLSAAVEEPAGAGERHAQALPGPASGTQPSAPASDRPA
jgi:sec-independent protein translocase protein TatB